jgi:uncharacterized protein YbaP (TraB family)
MTRARAIRLLACLVLGAFAVATTAAQHGLVFELSRDDQVRGYLVGTMHSEDPRVTALVDRIRPLVEEVDVVVLEIVPDATALVAVGAASLLSSDRRLRDIVGPRRYRDLETAAAARGLPLALLDRMKPWAVAVMLGMPAPETGRYLDLEIHLAALEHGRQVAGLETVAEQVAVFDGMGEELQLALLDEMVDQAGELPVMVEELTQVYLAGDLARLEQVARDQYAGSSPPVRRWFEDEVLRQRNERMAARLAALLEDDTVLAAIGAMHLTGDTGLITLLRQAGYAVEHRSR